MEKTFEELSLTEIFVLASCGKLPALECADDIGGLNPDLRRQVIAGDKTCH